MIVARTCKSKSVSTSSLLFAVPARVQCEALGIFPRSEFTLHVIHCQCAYHRRAQMRGGAVQARR